MRRMREEFAAHSIDWLPLKYHRDPKIPATLFDMAQGVARGLQKRFSRKFDIVHARTYPGGLIGLVLAPLVGAKFIYHNEGFYPDEQVDGGVWAEGSRPHRVALRLENLMYARADAVIALSHRAKAIIEKMPEVERKKTPVIFVPSCVDLERFHLPDENTVYQAGGEIRLVYIGSVGNRYILDKVGAFVAAARRRAGGRVRLQIYSKADPGLIERMLAEGGLEREAWALEAVPYAEMPARLAHYHAGLFFLTEGLSEHGCSPTKIGEYWAVGLPVVTTPNVSDTDEIVRCERVGVVIEKQSEENYLRAFEDLKRLLRDRELARRCRRAAEEHYALAPACERQFALYRDLLENLTDD
jgi:glycosyltransferase involved in cell wall biosynthesis